MLVYDSSRGVFVFSCCSKQSDRYITSAAVFPCERATGPSQSPRTVLSLERLARFWQASACSVLVIVLGRAPVSTLFVAFMLFIFNAFAVRKNGTIWRYFEKCELAGEVEFLCFSGVCCLLFSAKSLFNLPSFCEGSRTIKLDAFGRRNIIFA